MVPTSLANGTGQCCGSGYGIRCLFDPWIRNPGWVKSQDPGPDNPKSYFLELRNHVFGLNKMLKFFDVDRDPGWRKVGSGMEKSLIRDKLPGSATLVPALILTGLQI
jgi:hypothetical protein